MGEEGGFGLEVLTDTLGVGSVDDAGKIAISVSRRVRSGGGKDSFPSSGNRSEKASSQPINQRVNELESIHVTT